MSIMTLTSKRQKAFYGRRWSKKAVTNFHSTVFVKPSKGTEAHSDSLLPITVFC